jgi:predicted branched-subunit amino acid permease
MKFFKMGFISLVPIIPGIIPFGAVMGSAFADARLSFFDAMTMDMIVYAGAAQLATLDLMKVGAAIFVVVATGFIINLRFLLYSVAMSPYLKEAHPLIKLFCAFTLTDQSYAAMCSQLDQVKTNREAVELYLGSALCMLLVWHASVVAGFVFGNFAPEEISLDYAVPLSFIALLVPTLKTKKHYLVALVSSLLSLFFYHFPLKTGLIITALLSIALAWWLLHRESHEN